MKKTIIIILINISLIMTVCAMVSNIKFQNPKLDSWRRKPYLYDGMKTRNVATLKA